MAEEKFSAHARVLHAWLFVAMGGKMLQWRVDSPVPCKFFFKKHDIEVGRDSKYLGVQRMEVEACELSAVPTLKYVKR